MCERSLLSLGNYAAQRHGQAKFITPALVSGLHATLSGRDYVRSWSGLMSITNVAGALQFYSTIARHFLHLPMNILPHMVIGSGMPNYDAIVALLVQLANGGSDISGVSMSDYLTKTKSSKKNPNTVFLSYELENTTVIFIELIKVE